MTGVAGLEVTGTRCPVQRPVGVIGQSDAEGVSFGAGQVEGKPCVILGLSMSNGERLVAILHPGRAKWVAQSMLALPEVAEARELPL